MGSGSLFRLLALASVFSLLLGVVLGTPVLAAPMLSVSPASGAVGTKVTVAGEKFDSFIGDEIFMLFDDEEITSITVPPTGSFSFAFNVPQNAKPGKHEVRAKSELGSLLALGLFTVVKAEIKLSTRVGVIGTAVTVTGAGFYADKVVTLYYDGRMLGTESASATGEFTYSFTVPPSPAGEHTILAKNAEGNSAEIEFEVIPLITLNPTSGAGGDILLVSGCGFAPRSGLNISFKYEQVAYAKTNELGDFENAFFNVPALASGTYDVTVEDKDGNVGRAVFTIGAGARLDRTVANIGAELTISGSGFAVGGTITIAYDEVPVAQIRADTNGAFRAVLLVPPGKYGNHKVTVSDGVNTKQLVFAIESEPPPVPVLLLPREGSEAKPETQFDWSDVSDPSPPLTYHLQIAPSRDFSKIVLEKKLTSSEYTLTREERLAAVKKDSPYYWRVKAIDGAGNESGWSAPNSFLVLAPPAPALLLPEMGSQVEAETYFDWEEVTSLSPPITYHLQVASDKDFTQLVLEKTLTDSEYTLTAGEKLKAVKKEVPYYWRVKAIDGAGNGSEWSNPGSFHVGFTFALPSWLIYTLIGIGSILIGFLAFWLGRRTAYQKSEF